MENGKHSLIQINGTSVGTHEKEVEQEWQPKPIVEQVEILAQEFDLRSEITLEFLEKSFQKMVLPNTAYGWFAIPMIDAIVERLFPDSLDSTENYQRLTQSALDKISNRFWEFENLDCKSTPDKFNLPERTKRALDTICIHQKGSILIIPVRFGTKSTLGINDEFPLGSFFTACLGLTHSERYLRPDKPTITNENITECVGYGQVRCRTCWFDDARIKWNQATGLIPKFKKEKSND